MLLSDNQLQVMTTQRQIIYNCVRSCIYFRKIAAQANLAEPYIYIKSVLGADTIINWTKIFGNYKSEKHHWKNFVEFGEHISFKHEKFNLKSITEATGLTEDEWNKYRKNVLVTRDKMFAHTDSYQELAQLSPKFPRLDKIIDSASCYYKWLFELWNKAREIEPLHKLGKNNFSRNIDDEIAKFTHEAESYLVLH